ncbi:MAG: PT domain-containing protein [Clostridia bacterium]|nr:PT domain-containing protein [Clostridia bacterium]
MKKLIIAFALVLVLCLAACAEERPVEANNTEAPTDAPTITDAPTAEPVVTDAPTPAPTEAPTPAPAVEYAFEDCAEVIARFTPGEADDQVHYIYDDGFEDGEDMGPEYFSVSDGRLYIFDRYTSMLVYDIEGGTAERCGFPNGAASQFLSPHYPFIVSGGRAIGVRDMIDFETGTRTSLMPPRSFVDACSVLFLAEREGRIYLYLLEDEEHSPTGDRYLEYELDTELNAWILKRSYCYTGESGALFMEGHRGYYMNCELRGEDGEGNFYMTKMELVDESNEYDNYEYTILKYTSEADLISSTKVRFNEDEYFWGPHMIVTEDGGLYIMVDYRNEIVVYKVNL